MTPQVYIIFEKRPAGSDHAEGWWQSAAEAAGLTARMLYAPDLSAGCDSAGRFYVLNGAERLAAPRAVLMRCYCPAVGRTFEAMGVTVVNTPESMELCRDKYRTSLALAAAGIPAPATMLIPGGASPACLASILGNPFVVKPNTGSKGEGVRLVDAAQPDLGIDEPCQEMIAQQYVATSRGRDIRVWVVAGQAVAAVVRSNPGSLVSNFAAGGSASLFGGSDRSGVFALAERAARACGLFFAGVDILFGPDGSYCVCEVNGNAGFRTLSLNHGPDLPAIVMQKLSEI